jgi:predicted dehydrogenase
VTIEKPIALQGEDYREVCVFLKDCPTKFIVNHQLRYHDRIIALQKAVLGGEIGEVRFIHATSRLNMAGQGTHATDLMFAFNRESPPIRVFGHVSGARTLQGSHAGPDMAGGEIIFENGVHGLIACGSHAPSITTKPGEHLHKRIAVYGTRGLVHWTMHGWEKCVDGKYESGEHSYYDVDVFGQANLTDALADWVMDDSKPHGNRLEISLRESLLSG